LSESPRLPNDEREEIPRPATIAPPRSGEQEKAADAEAQREGKPELGYRAFLLLAAIVVVIAGLRIIGPVVLPLLTAAFIAAVSAPVLGVLVRAKVPQALAVGLTCLLDVAIVVGVAALVGGSLSGLSEAVPRYQSAFTTLHHTSIRMFQSMGIPAETDDLLFFSDANAVVSFVTDLAGELTSFASNAFLVVLLVVFLLFELDPFQHKLAMLLGTSTRLERFAAAAAMMQRYLFVKTGVSLLVAALVGLLLHFAGVDFAFLWALATFLLNYVPSIGPAIATAPSTAIAVLTLSPGAALAVGIGQLTIHVVVGNVLEPRLMGGALGISTLAVFVSMLFWGWLWGPLGALFAVPLTLLLIFVFELFPDTRWLAVMLASREWAEEKRIEWGWPAPDERKAQASSSGTLSAPLLSIGPPKSMKTPVPGSLILPTKATTSSPSIKATPSSTSTKATTSASTKADGT
jgi:AI-2 transport protein TqsA